jgi:thiol:disulfide interchange protein DsbD
MIPKLTMIMRMAAHLVLAASTPLLANVVTTAHVQAELGSVVTTIQPGASFWTVLHLRMQDGWHTYWQNPGDAGLATVIHWTLPEGFVAEDIVWPYPKRLPVGPLMNYGYDGEVSLLTRITAPADIAPGQSVVLRAESTWVVCAKICVPEAATFDLRLSVSVGKPQEDTHWMAMFAEAQRSLPQPAPWQVVFTGDQDTLTLSVAAPDFVAMRHADIVFFPLAYGIIDHAAPQQVRITEPGLDLILQRGTLDQSNLTRIEGVLVVQETRDGVPHTQAFAISARPAKAS